MKVSARSRARQLAVQGLYEWHLSDNKIDDIATQCLDAKRGKNLDEPYFEELIYKVSSMVDVLNELLTPFLSRDIDEIDPVERAILQLGTYELTQKIEIPYKVIINEAIELAKTFGAEQSHKFVNGILDKVAEQNRAVEFKNSAKPRAESVPETSSIDDAKSNPKISMKIKTKDRSVGKSKSQKKFQSKSKPQSKPKPNK